MAKICNTNYFKYTQSAAAIKYVSQLKEMDAPGRGNKGHMFIGATWC